MRTGVRYIASLFLTLAIMVSIVPLTVMGAEPKLVHKPIVGKVKLDSSSTVNVKNVQLIPSNDKQTLAYTLEFVNKGNKVINILDYWTKVKLSNGTLVPVKMTGLDTSKTEIAANSSAEYTFVATLNRQTKYSDLSIQLIKWDFSATNYTRILGNVKLPANYTPINSVKSVNVEGTKLGINFKNFRIFNLKEEKRIEFDLEYTNQGYRSVTIPKYKIYFMTSDQYLYEMTQVKSDDVKIQPKAKATIGMKMLLPLEEKSTAGSVIFALNDEQTKLEVPVLTTDIKMNATVTNVKVDSLGTEKSFAIEDTKYSIKLESIQQLPLEDENIITSVVTIANQSTEVVPIPDIIGTYYLDGVVLAADKTKKTQLSHGVGIPVKGNVQIAIHTKLPYSTEFDKVDLDLHYQVKTDNDETIKEKIASYAVNKRYFKGYNKVAIGDEGSITTDGKTTGYKIHSLQTYEGNSSYLYNVLLEVQNKNNRASAVNKLSAYMKTVNGSYYPMKISEVKDKVNPNGKVLISLSTRIPSYTNTNDLKLILGEFVDESTYLSATEFEIPRDTGATGQGLKNMNVYPYTLNFNAILVDLDRNANLTFQYELTKSSDYDYVPDGHSIIMEVVDGKESYTKEFKFESDLELGIHQQTMVAQMNIDNPASKIMEMDGLLVNVYDQFEGHRKLLGSRRVFTIFIR